MTVLFIPSTLILLALEISTLMSTTSKILTNLIIISMQSIWVKHQGRIKTKNPVKSSEQI
jgi:hypothetical protein